MKKITSRKIHISHALIVFTAVMLLLFFSVARSEPRIANNSLVGSNRKNQATIQPASNSDGNNTQINKMKIKIGSRTFTATLDNNETAKAFKAMLPLTLKMDDLNSNEKKYDLPKNLPGRSRNPKAINAGDLMIWSGNTLVLFYKSFSTSYSYARLGHVDDPSGLTAMLGAGNVTITYEL